MSMFVTYFMHHRGKVNRLNKPIKGALYILTINADL